MNKTVKILMTAFLSSTMIFSIGCSVKDNEDINKIIASKLNLKETQAVSNLNDEEVLSFKLLYCESDENTVNIKGSTQFLSGKQAFSNIRLENTEKKALTTIDEVKQVVSKFAIKSVKYKEVENTNNFNKTMDSLTKSENPFYYKDYAKVVDITTPKIDTNKKIATFKTKTYVKSFFVPKDSRGEYIEDENTKYDNFVVTNEIYVRLTDNQIEIAKDNPSSVYKIFTDAVEKHEEFNYSINKVNVEKVDSQTTITQKEEDELSR